MEVKSEGFCMFSQEVIDHLNRDSDEHARWLESNEILRPFITNSHVIIQPTLMPNVRSVSASDNEYGRIISIEQRTYKWSYLVRLTERQAIVGLVEDLVKRIDMVDGHCRIDNDFLVLDLPSGYYLEVIYEESLRFEIKKIEFVDLALLL